MRFEIQNICKWNFVSVLPKNTCQFLCSSYYSGILFSLSSHSIPFEEQVHYSQMQSTGARSSNDMHWLGFLNIIILYRDIFFYLDLCFWLSALLFSHKLIISNCGSEKKLQCGQQSLLAYSAIFNTSNGWANSDHS